MSDIHALSGAYAVDALDDLERARFERHLADCATCRGEVASLREASGLLAETTTSMPSAGLRDRVLADIATVRPLPPVIEREEHRPRRRLVSLLVAAAAVVAIGVGGVVWQQTQDEGSPDQFSQIAAADDAHTFTLPVGEGGTVSVVVSKRENRAFVETEGMPAAPPGHQYVLWLQHDDVMVPAGVMPAGSDNKVLLSGDAATANGAGITVETAGAEPTQPSDDVVALFSFET